MADPGETVEEPPQKKEAAVLSANSLAALAKEIGAGGLVLAMYLNIPTTTLVNLRLEGSKKKAEETDITNNMLMYWKTMRETARDKDKVNDLERALRETGRQDAADAVLDKHRDNQELSPDSFGQ